MPKAAMYDLPLVTYDNDGNILELKRNGVNATLVDDFDYTYEENKNRLLSVTNFGTQIFDYNFDNNGNVIADEMRGINSITYNISNLPEQIVKGSSNINYWYNANGNRIRKQEGDLDEIYVLGVNGETEAVFNANGVVKFFNILIGGEIIGRFIPAPPVDLYLSNTTLSGTYEAQNSITVEDNVTVTGTATLTAGNNIHLKPGLTASSSSNFTAKIGTVTNTTKRFYYLKDHLGSIRVVVNESGEIVSYDDYDPWGIILSGRSDDYGFVNDKYKFTSKERDVETGYDYFGARYYDSRIGRWLQVDPLAYKSPFLNPYHYTQNNPIRFFDPDGQEEVTIQYRAFIPQESVAGFGGDNRTFSADPNASSRVTITVRIETDPAKNQGKPLLGSEVLVSPTRNNLTGGERISDGPQMPIINVIQSSDGTVTISVEMNMRNPYVPIGSGIRSDVNISVNQDATSAGVSGTVSGSPSFEANFSVDDGQNQNVPLQSARTSTIGFIIGLQQTNQINTSVQLQQKEKKEENK